jgi:uncharacterized protein YggE
MRKLLATLVMTLLLGSAARAQPAAEPPKQPSITVSGEATIFAEPDQAQIDIGVVTQARNAPEASRENAERLSRVLAAVKKHLGEGDEVKTSGYALTPNYRHPPGGKPEIVGYTASNMLRIKTTKLTLVGSLIDSAMQAGANNIHRLIFTLKDELAAQLEALRLAAAKAKTKAVAIAASLGLKIVRVAAVNEGERQVQPIFRQALAARSEAAPPPTPVEPGTVEVRSTVSMTVEVTSM